jgi:hypothetical protein
MACCRVLHNNEILINEAHTNNYIFVVDRVPTSFLMSKFADDDVYVGADIQQVKNIDVIREMNNDVMNLALYLQSYTMPDVNVDITQIPTQFASVPVVTGKLNFSPLQTNFVNDENYFIWRFFYYWLIAAHNPEERNKRWAKQHFSDFHVNGWLIVLNNHREKILEIRFHDMHPQAMGSVDFKDTDPEKVIIPITWAYSDFYPTDDFVTTRV